MSCSVHVEPVDLKTYERALASAPAALTPFHRPEWLLGVADGLAYACTFVRVTDQDEAACLIPWLHGRRGPFTIWGSPVPGSMTPYIGPVPLHPLPAGRGMAVTVDAAEYLMISRRVSLMSLGFQEGDATAIDADKWGVSAPETYLLDLNQDEDTLWKGLKSRARGVVRKAETEGVEVGPADDPAVLESFYQMLLETFKRRGATPPHSLGLYQSLWRHVHPAGMLRVLVARHHGKPVSIGLFLHDDRTVHFLSGASDPEALASGAASAVQWNLIRWAARSGRETYDLGGKGIPSIDKFKESFGPEITSYVRLERSSLPARAARRLLEWSYRAGWRRYLPGGWRS